METKRFVLDESKIDQDRELFRPKYLHFATLVRRDLAQAIEAEGFVGILWLELSDFSELF
jgi:hypothetical protein